MIVELFQSEAFLLCLLASLVWAPFVYSAALLLDRGQALAVSEKIWLGALTIAVLPTMLAPAFSSAGFSLRPASITQAAPAPSLPPVQETVLAEMEQPAGVSSEAAPYFAEPAPINQMPVSFTETTDPILFSAPALISSVSGLSSETILNMVGLLYIYGAILAFGLWLMRSTGFALNVLRARPVEDAALMEAVNAWRRQIGVREKLRIKSSRMVSSVCVTGYLQPVILIPHDIKRKVSFDDLVMMCAHELAHIKRGDVRLFTVSAAARILFWFNPFIKRITARAELAAEQCADAYVVSRGVNRRDYAACFVEGLRYAAGRPTQAFAALPTFTPLDRKGRRKRLDSILSATAQAALPTRTKIILGAATFCAGAAAFTQAAVAVHPASKANQEGILTEIPTKGRLTLTHGAEWKDKKTGKIRGPHKGVDIAAKRGTDVVAPGAGIVLEATDYYKSNPDWGKVIVIDHGDNVKTRYAHLDSYGVLKGDRVWAGDVIAKVGSTGNSSGSHLHFETIVDGETVDPLTILDRDAIDVPSESKSSKQKNSKRIHQKTDPLKRSLSLSTPKVGVDPNPTPIILNENETLMEVYETIVEDMVDLEEDQADDAADIIASMIDNSIYGALVNKSERRQKLTYIGGEELTPAKRAKMERALAKMRKEMAQNKNTRSRARKDSRHAIHQDKHTHYAEEKAREHADHHAKKQRKHAEKQLHFAFEQSRYTHDNMLKIRDEALEAARRSLIEAERKIQQDLKQAEARLSQSEHSIKLAKLPKKDFERFKEDLHRARADLREQKNERVEALREAEETIAKQQREIENLRTELAKRELTAAAQ